MEPFESIAIGSMEIRNRLLMAPVKTAFGDKEGKVTDKLVHYYRRRAAGGVGAIIVEPLFVDPAGKEHPKQLGAATETQVEGLSRLVEAIHGEGAKAIAHLNHAGRAANPKATGRQPEAPSAVPCGTTGATPAAMSEERIQEVVAAYGAAARRALEAGFDAVEVQCGLGYLVAQFYSPRTNMRTDAYGGTEEKRSRFLREVLDAVRTATGGRIPVLARMSWEEKVDGGLDLAGAARMARELVSAGVAALHVVSGSACDSPPWYYQHMSLPEGVNARQAQEIKKEVQVPVIAAGRLGDPERIREVLTGGVVDLVALGRPLVADPDLPRKMESNQDDLVVRCGGCLQGCLLGVKSGAGVGCIVNPELGHEGEAVTPASTRRRIVVVGGGPAGLTAARVAAERGHDVVVLERSSEVLGGQFAMSYLAPGKQAMQHTVDSLVRLARRSGADIRMGVEAGEETVLALNPDAVVVATGAEPVQLPVPGLEEALTGAEILRGAVTPGPKVLVVGGGMVGVEVAEFLGERGHEVDVVEMLGEVARDMEPVTRALTMKRLAALPVRFHTDCRIQAVRSGVAVLATPDGEKELGPFDTVVVAVGTRPHDPLSSRLEARGIEVHVVGDARELGQVQGAVASGWEVARKL